MLESLHLHRANALQDLISQLPVISPLIGSLSLNNIILTQVSQRENKVRCHAPDLNQLPNIRGKVCSRRESERK